MNLLPLHQLGAREVTPTRIDFGVLLPHISNANGTALFARIIHERDQFRQAVPPVDIPLTHSTHATYGDYWAGSLDFGTTPAPPHSANWGREGRYVYRYVLKRPGVPELDYIIDPCAREYGVGNLSALTLGYSPHLFSPTELTYKTPALRDVVAYELMISEFGGDIEKTIELLDYLQDLGVNLIEVMPVSNVANRLNWGYDPLGYFGVDERFGKRRDFQRLVDEAHQRDIAVIVDSVYGHVEGRFPYASLYQRLGGNIENPFIGAFATDEFGESTDFTQQLTRDYYFTVNVHWLETFRVDGFRYDAVQQYWRRPDNVGYPELAAATRAHVAAQANAGGHWQRFFPADDGELRLIQVAESLGDPVGVLQQTVSNSTWQNRTLDAAGKCARGEAGAIADLGLQLGLVGYPETVTTDGVAVTKSPLQYLENHDHARFVCNFGTIFKDARQDELLREGDRERRWFKTQPYLIGLLTAKGTPLLWQGQEIGQNFFVPQDGYGRILLVRPVDFNYFYDPIGKSLIRLVRRLIKLRQAGAQFRRGEHFFHNDPARYHARGLLLFSRQWENTFSLVALNFTDQEQTATFEFPRHGDYREELEGQRDLLGVVAGVSTTINVPSNYGCIWTLD